MSSKVDKKSELALIDWALQNRYTPLPFCQAAYPWLKGELESSPGPRRWQAEMMDMIGRHLSSPTTRFKPLQIAVASGHACGKSSLISMLTHWGLSTCVDTKIVVTANTEKQLLTKTWPEMNKWFRLALNAHWFNMTATAIYSSDKEHERTWRADAIPWSSNNTESFAGLHNKGKRIIVIFDEGSAIDDKIWEVVEGAIVGGETEIIWIAFGNPTRASGRFRECFGKYKHNWVTRQIDSRTIEGVNLEQFQRYVRDYGEDSDFVRVRVRGQFPLSGSVQFIGSDLVEAARKRYPEAKLTDPLVMGVDVARFGDDATVICLRRGRDAKSIPWENMRGADTTEVADKIANLYSAYKPDAIFVDGGGVGGGVIDRLRLLKVPGIQEVQFGASASDIGTTDEMQVRYANKRAEMWGNMKDWLRGGMIPDSPDLASELTAVEYGFTFKKGHEAILLEKKADMKRRGLSSPDQADALALTFAYPVFPSDHTHQFENRHSQHVSHYNPLSVDWINKTR